MGGNSLYKISFAFTNLIVILCGIPLVVLKERNSLSFGAGASICNLWILCFIKFGQSLGFKGVMDPLASAWIGNIIFTVGAIILFLKSKS